MKINGTINIMGMTEVIMRKPWPDRDEYGTGMQVIERYEMNTDEKLIRWGRYNKYGKTTTFFRTNEEMMSTVKALALNPNAKLTFNDGVMYIDFIG